MLRCGGALNHYLRRQDEPLELAQYQFHRPSKGIRDVYLYFHHRILYVIESVHL
jgi:hypothetical protein